MSRETVFRTNLQTLTNATELASKVVEKIAGEEIANTVDGKVMVSYDIKTAVAAKLQGCLMTNKGGNTQ